MPMFFLHTIPSLSVFDLAVNPASRRHYISLHGGRVFKVVRGERVAGPQNLGVPKCKYVIGPQTLV